MRLVTADDAALGTSVPRSPSLTQPLTRDGGAPYTVLARLSSTQCSNGHTTSTPTALATTTFPLSSHLTPSTLDCQQPSLVLLDYQLCTSFSSFLPTVASVAMASFSASCVLLLALLVASLFDSTHAIVYNYTAFFNPTSGCSLTVGLDGSIYVGLCSQPHSQHLTHTHRPCPLCSLTHHRLPSLLRALQVSRRL